MLGPGFHTTLNVLAWIISIAAGLGVVLGGIFLMPAVTSLIASVFVDDVAEHVEREHYPAERPGDALPLGVAIPEGIKTALLTILVYLIALPFVLFAGAGFLIFFIATAWLLGREYFELAAMRFRSPAEAKAMRKDNAATVFTAGLFIAAFVSIPIVNLATPLFGMAFMVHMHKRLSGPRPELIEPARRTGVPTDLTTFGSGRSRANGTSSRPAIATQASIAQASLTQSASDAFSTIGRTNATAACVGRTRRPVGEQRRIEADRLRRADISRQQANPKILGIDCAAAIQDRVDQRDADGAAEIPHQVEQPAGVGDFDFGQRAQGDARRRQQAEHDGDAADDLRPEHLVEIGRARSEWHSSRAPARTGRNRHR